MVAGELESLKEFLGELKAQSIFSFVEQAKSFDFKTGEWQFLEHEMKAIVLDTSNYVEGIFEAHKVYDDVHIVISGSDTVYIGEKMNSKIKSDYNDIGDYSLYHSQTKISARLDKNTFAIIPNNELHSNQIGSLGAKKVVVKVKR